MFEDIIREVERMNDEWVRDHPIDQEARDHPLQPAPTRPAEGADSSGTVHATIDAAGLPESITFDGDWRRAVGTERLARAVAQACENAAIAQVMASFSALVPAPHAPAGTRGRSVDPPPGAVDQIRDHLRVDPELDLVTGTGAAAYGNVVIVLSELGMRSFAAAPGWAARTTDDELADVVAAALASARAELAEARDHRFGGDFR